MPDVHVVPAQGYVGEAPSWGLSAVADAVVLAGGMDYVEPELPRHPAMCTKVRKDGSACRAFASEDGMCPGHRRVVNAG